MKRNPIWMGLLFGLLTAGAVIALAYLGQRFVGLPFIPFDIFDWMARILPGGLLTVAIDTMVMVIDSFNLGPTSQVAKRVEQSIAILQLFAAGGVFGILLGFLGRLRPERLVLFGMIGGGILMIPAYWAEVSLGFPPAGIVATTIYMLILFFGWGAVLGRVIQFTSFPQAVPENPALSRREFLYLIGAGSFTVIVTALGISVLSGEGDGEETAEAMDKFDLVGADNTGGPAQSPPDEVLRQRIEPAPGTRPELTSNAEFYRIDINTMSPTVDAESWRLELSGLVDNPMTLTLDEIRSRPSVSQVITLECISNRLGGDLISTAVWTGIRLRDLLDEAGLQQGAQEVFIESVDGFYESVAMQDMMDERTLLVYEMNGEPLPVEHGFPLRIYIPNRFGMKQPKWITRMEVIDHEGRGYWVERGWSATAIPPTTSVVDTVYEEALDGGEGVVPVGGIAYAGARGISRVEVQVDDGPWQEAQLIAPALSPLTWVQWRYDWPVEFGRHTFKVRAYDGNEDLQRTEVSEPHPSGATGIHSLTETLSDS